MHYDVKPSNVLVTSSGRVVILDFGLVADSDDDSVQPERSVPGTPGYMAPERVLKGVAGPPADLYAVGAVLFRALTGTLPPLDASIRSALLGASIAPTRPSAFAAVPRVLDDLCIELLASDPSARPSAREVRTRLGTEQPVAAPSAQFVGRDDELAQIFSAQHDSAHHSIVVAFDGASGIGKTALLAEVISRLRAREDHVLVLTGRCYEHEGIPYKAIDAVMDALGDALAHAPPEVLRALPVDARLFGVLFPALCRVPVFAREPSRLEERGAVDQQYELRRGAERVGRQLLKALAAWRPLVIAIDDFQWADPDSLTFLTALTHAPDSPPLLLLISSRTPVVALGKDVRRLSIAALKPVDARALAASLLGTDSTSADRIVAEAGGNPFFVSELALRGAGNQARLEDVLWARISACREESRVVLELIAVAAAPMAQNIIAEAAGLDASTFTRVAHHLRSKRLVRTTGLLPHHMVEAHHDRIRETIVAKLSGSEKSARHLRLATVIERLRPDDFASLVTHFEWGGDGARAATYAIVAGDQAARALAFERAAAFYRHALSRLSREVCEQRQLREKLADALANAGLGAEAALEYQAAAATSAPAHALELQRRAAENLLRSGRLDEGLLALRRLLAQLNLRMPRTPAQAFVSLLFHRARVTLRGLRFVESPTHQLAAADLFRADTLWAAAARLGAIDTIRAADFQARHLLLCLKLGEPFRVARALLAEASFVSVGGPTSQKSLQNILHTARPLVDRLQHPYATAMLQFTEGFSDYQFGSYARAFVGLQRAAELFRTTCTGASHDVAVCDRFALDCLFNLGELAEVCRRVPALLDAAEQRGDQYMTAELRTGLPNIIWLCSDQPEQAQQANELGIALWSRQSFYLQHYYHSLAATHIALYTNDGERAFATIEEGWRSLKASLLDKVQAVRTEALSLRARAAIAQGGPRARVIATQAIARLSREAVPSAPGLAAAARAGLAAQKCDWTAALELLRTAEHALTTAGVGLVAAACRFQLGRMGTGPEAPAIQAEAEAWMRARGIARPDRFAQVFVPGFPNTR